MRKTYRLLISIMATGVFLIGSISCAVADDLGTVPPAPNENYVKANSPTSEFTVDNGDGTFTFTQVIDEASSSPHYNGPFNDGSNYGFEHYSWWDQDYGWQHSFPYTPNMSLISVNLEIRAWDVDAEATQTDGEFDGISGDGTWLNPQFLQGLNNQWSVTVFDVDSSTLHDGLIDVNIDIDMTHDYDNWATTLDSSKLTVVYSYSTNNLPYEPTLSLSPDQCVGNESDLVVTVTGPNPADSDGDAVTYEYRWFVDVGSGFFVDDDFAGRGEHTGNTVPAEDTVVGDIWRVQVTPIDEHGAEGTYAVSTFLEVVETCSSTEIPEFPTMSLPIISVLGLMFLFSRRKD